MDPMNPMTIDLDARLLALAEVAPWPPTPDVVGGALARMRAPARPVAARPGGLVRGDRRRVVVLALAALLLLAGVAVAALGGLPGLRIVFTDSLPTPNVSGDAQAMRAALGERVTLEDARQRLGVDLLVPEPLGGPDEVYLGAAGRLPRVALVYVATVGEPILTGDIGLLVTEWRGVIDEGYASKWVRDDEGGTAEAVTVRGTPGYWISGRHHALGYLEEVSGVRRPVIRLVGDVLVWQEGATVYRIETPLGRDATLAIAESMR
jgi:hypothetical protein